MKIAVISPHVDDALFSVGEHMLSRPNDEFTVVCPCAAPFLPAEEPDHSKYRILLAEHDDVMARGGWKALNGPFFDDGARSRGHGRDMLDLKHPHILEMWLVSALQFSNDDAFRDVYDEWWVPFGIYHPDHVDVAMAAGRIARPTARWSIYEELPYRVDHPEYAPRVSGRYELTGFGPLGEQLEAKRRLCHVYASQIGPNIERCLYAPERLWRFKWSA